MSRASKARFEDLTPAGRVAWNDELQTRGRVTNMKRTLLQSDVAYSAYMGWYPLWDELVKITGTRAAAVFAHAISARNGCVLCTVYFRKELTEAGLAPDAFEPSRDEALLMRLSEAMIEDRNHIGDALWQELQERFSNTEIINLVAFAGMMIAVNTFNSALGVEVDTELERFLPPLSARRQPAEASDS